ncbi:cbb3-type cytochrome c oxidase N-terminal domain-containing protein [Rhodopirellula sallentina]|uniref:Cytochrome c oxidase cbb3-type subunit III n=1 Tax=Rhodopirellula sallentina SM41 TaxID=1263870 RepID=M5UAP3_9BACT|nr:cbb3-type cytochrome c oxidase N-terminal domain-containing protein [Rhodopirellula sallentina]EMI58369.1 cytochrome c oxidase cbb3-type subunit III [Rhodopirellula sallentina SM41]
MSSSHPENQPIVDDAPKTDHAYDGIEEFDNPLPGWWKWLFIATIAFCPFYWLYYHGGTPGRSIEDGYGVALAANTRLQFEEIGELQPTEATLVEYMGKDSWLRVGKIVFQTHCVSCHDRDGQGKVGPNLTDEYFKNITTIEDIAKVINNGAAAGAMPKWSNRLHPNEIVLVSSYVASMRGQNLEGPRGAEGKTIPPWPEPSASSEDAAEPESSEE